MTEPTAGMPGPGPGGTPGPYVQAPGRGPIGKVRSTGLTLLLFLVTFGLWGFVWYYQVHEEMKRHSGEGLGGPIALIITAVVGIAMPYLTANEVGNLYAARGQEKPVSAMTGLWVFPGILILVGPFVWFIKTNGALNDYWRSLGAT